MGLEIKPSAQQGFIPPNYAGEESVTFPNGFIMKTGSANDTGTTTTVTFATPFPNGILSAFVCGEEDAGGSLVWIDGAGSISVNDIVVRRSNGLIGVFYWLAIGW